MSLSPRKTKEKHVITGGTRLKKCPPDRKAVRQGFDPELFITELSCRQLGAKLKLFILTVRPESTYQHQKNKFSCRCGERVRLKMTPSSAFAEKKVFSRQKKGLQNGPNKNLENVQEPIPGTRDT